MPPVKTSEVELELKSALLSTGLVQPVESLSKGGYVEVLSRQIPGQEKTWLDVVKSILVHAEQKGLEIHVSRRYLLRNGELVYGWFIAIDAKSQKKLLDTVVELKASVLDSARPSLNAGPQPMQPQQSPAPRPAARRPRSDEEALTQATRNIHGPMNGMRPRQPEYSGPDPAPPRVSPTITTVEQGRDAKGRPVVVQEMPLPHFTGDPNRPNAKGRGATGVG